MQNMTQMQMAARVTLEGDRHIISTSHFAFRMQALEKRI